MSIGNSCRKIILFQKK